MNIHPYISNELNEGNLMNDDFTFIEEIENPTEEYLVFIIHGIGQTETTLKHILQKIKKTISLLYTNKNKFISKQLHVRMINWKYLIIKDTSKNISKLIDVNNTTKYPKMFINAIPQDILFYLNEKNKFEIINDIINQMNQYYNIVKKHRPLFKGNVSLIGHSLGGVILYDILRVMHFEKKKQNSNIKERESMREIGKLNRNERINTLLNVIEDYSSLLDDSNRHNYNSIYQTENYLTVSSQLLLNYYQEKIISSDERISPLLFSIDHLFLLGSPLSLFLTIEHKANPFLEEMEVVKDFHNIIHPMDPVAYRIEPLIEGYEYENKSFILPHWENDGAKNELLDIIVSKFCGMSNDRKDKNKPKRYDFMIQENLIEKGCHVIGFLFSHMAYWNNPDVFYFIIKMIHWQGYTELKDKNVN